MAIAIVGMVKLEKSVASDECPEFGDLSVKQITDMEGPFHWSTTQQGLVISIYFAGYLIGMFPSGYFADR